MKYYKGVCQADQAYNGGSYVLENGFGHEEFNFLPIHTETDQMVCFGFVEPKSNRGKTNTMHIEKIEGCALLKKEPMVEDVLVVWCATRERGDTTVVGWYKHAEVWRDLQPWIVTWDDGREEERYYNIKASAQDCTLLPQGERNLHKWWVPTAQYTRSFGFGQSMVWYPVQEEAKDYLRKLVDSIEEYTGENWLERYPNL
ncbi:hypothetical protein [Megamonas hypermegale]|uniref:hypothetical protein n=1 Tax=Megamonas hypermegale TaxID=158847 RepID=UPI0026EEFEF4|nr:hypothetical protein [Megamonas hypermegale]